MSAPPTDLPDSLLGLLTAGGRAARLVHVRRLPQRTAQYAGVPPWTAPPLRAALARAGVEQLWSHQREAAEAAYAGDNVVLSTGTASGKSLGFLIPALTAILEGAGAASGRGATALYL